MDTPHLPVVGRPVQRLKSEEFESYLKAWRGGETAERRLGKGRRLQKGTAGDRQGSQRFCPSSHMVPNQKCLVWNINCKFASELHSRTAEIKISVMRDLKESLNLHLGAGEKRSLSMRSYE